jgi:hypothetical protein
MKVPRRISELLNQKQDFIDRNRDKLEKSVIKLQSQLLDKLMSEIYPELDVVNGVIQDTKKNYQILTGIDKLYKNFNSSSLTNVASQVSGTTSGIITLGETYFKTALASQLTSSFANVLKTTAQKMDLRIGLNDGKIVSGGFLESLIKDTTLENQIKNFVSKSVTGQAATKDFIKGLSAIVTGDEKPGGLEKQYQRYAYDLYQQYDRAYNGSLADQLELNYFIYQGGLVEDSRDFCAAHNNKVWSREESETWMFWTPVQGEYPAGYKIKQKDIYSVPSYLGYPGYQPLIDFGGYRCRHGIGWISQELAEELRPSIKNN